MLAQSAYISSILLNIAKFTYIILQLFTMADSMTSKNAGYEGKSHVELNIKALPENTHALAVSLDYLHYVAIMLDFLFAVLNCPSRITNPR